MIERDKKKENLQKNTKRITKEKELYDLLSKKQKITLKMLSTRTFHQKILNDIFTLSAEEIQECEGFEKNLAVSNAIKALFLLFVKELRNPMGKIENINTVFDKFFHLIHGYDKSKVLTSFIYRLFKDNKDSNGSLIKSFVVLYKEYLHSRTHITKKNFKKYRDRELKKTYVNINDCATFYNHNRELLAVKNVEKVDIVTWRKAPFYDKAKWFFDTDNFSTVKNILSEKTGKNPILLQNFLRTIYDKRYNKIVDYTFEKYQQESEKQRSLLLYRDLKDLSANDLYFVVGLFEFYMNDTYRQSPTFQAQIMNPVTQLVLDGLDFDPKDYKKIKIAKGRIPNIFAQYFQEDIANIEYGLDTGRTAFNFEQITESLLSAIAPPKKTSLKNFTLDLGGATTHCLLTEAVTQEKAKMISEKYALPADIFRIKSYHIKDFFSFLLTYRDTVGIQALFQDVGIDINKQQVKQNLLQYIELLGRADSFVLDSINRAKKESDKGIIATILGHGKVGIADFGTDMTGKGVKWQIGSAGKINPIFDNGYTKQQLALLKKEFLAKNKGRIADLKKIAQDSSSLEFWTDNKGTIVPGMHPAPVKSYERAIQKLIEDYKCDFSKSTDISRATLEYPNLKKLIEGMQSVIRGCKDDPNVDQVAIVDKIGPVFEMAEQATGYRDIKLLVKLRDGNTIELQFHTTQTLEIKQKGLGGEIIKKRMFQEGISFDDKEMSYLFERINEYKRNKEKLFTSSEDDGTLKRTEENILLRDKNEIFVHTTYLSGDMFFYAHRDLKNGLGLKQKLQKAEMIVWEYAWEQEMKEFMPKPKNGKKK